MTVCSKCGRILPAVDYEEVCKVLRQETKSSSLTDLRDDFYQGLGALIEQLHCGGHDESAEKMADFANRIFTLRAEKLVLLSVKRLDGLATLPGDIKRMSQREFQDYHWLVERLRESRSEVLSRRAA